MESLDYWKLCDEISVVQAALLIVGEDPANNQEYIDNWEPHSRPNGYDAVISALQNAILSGKLSAKLKYDVKYPQSYDDNDGLPESVWYSRETPNWHRSTIELQHIKSWLMSRGFRSGFFFAADVTADEFLDTNHPCYAPKLAASVNAWKAVSVDEKRLNGKTPKQALEKWLREHASQYGLTKDDGNPNEQGIEEIAKVANWNTQGGAAKTPTAANTNPPTLKKGKKLKAVGGKEAEEDVLF